MPKSEKEQLAIYEKGKKLRSKYGVEGDAWYTKLLEWLREQGLSNASNPQTAESIYSLAKTAVESRREKERQERPEKEEKGTPPRSITAGTGGGRTRTVKRSDHDKVRIYQKGNDLRSQYGKGGDRWYTELWKWMLDEDLTSASKPASARGTYSRCKRFIQKRREQDRKEERGQEEPEEVQELRRQVDDLQERLRPYDGMAGGISHLIAQSGVFSPIEEKLDRIVERLDRLIEIWEPEEAEEDVSTDG